MGKRYKGWKNPPPVAAVYGSEGFLQRRVVRLAIKEAVKAKRRVDFIDAKDPEAFEDAMSSAVMFAEPQLLVISNIKDLDPFAIGAHAKEDDNTVSILLVHEGNPKDKVSELVEFVPKPYRFSYPKPPPYKVGEVAAKFLIEEAKSRKIEIDPDLADALVSKVGPDLGVLSFELLKVEALLTARGEGPKVSPVHLKDTMVLSGEVDMGAVVDAVGRASVPRVLKAMSEVKMNSGKDPTLLAVAWISKKAMTWLHAATLLQQGAGDDEGASRTGTPPYVYKSFIVPVAKRWQTSRLMSLVKRLAVAESAVKSGRVDPWTVLECGLVASCHSVRGAR